MSLHGWSITDQWMRMGQPGLRVVNWAARGLLDGVQFRPHSNTGHCQLHETGAVEPVSSFSLW